jgi:hypothetical protein
MIGSNLLLRLFEVTDEMFTIECKEAKNGIESSSPIKGMENSP